MMRAPSSGTMTCAGVNGGVWTCGRCEWLVWGVCADPAPVGRHDAVCPQPHAVLGHECKCEKCEKCEKCGQPKRWRRPWTSARQARAAPTRWTVRAPLTESRACPGPRQHDRARPTWRTWGTGRTPLHMRPLPADPPGGRGGRAPPRSPRPRRRPSATRTARPATCGSGRRPAPPACWGPAGAGSGASEAGPGAASGIWRGRAGPKRGRRPLPGGGKI